ncbi:hypothetical protein D3C87_587840 [compost metagenome]
MAEYLSYHEYPKEQFPMAEYPYVIQLENQFDGNYIMHMFSLDGYISTAKLVGLYKELEEFRFAAYGFTHKADAMQIKLGWDPNQDEIVYVSGPGW